MFKQGDVIFVGSKGVCTVNDIKQNAFIGCDKTKEYYVLKPLYEKYADITVNCDGTSFAKYKSDAIKKIRNHLEKTGQK